MRQYRNLVFGFGHLNVISPRRNFTINHFGIGTRRNLGLYSQSDGARPPLGTAPSSAIQILHSIANDPASRKPFPRAPDYTHPRTCPSRCRAKARGRYRDAPSCALTRCQPNTRRIRRGFRSLERGPSCFSGSETPSLFTLHQSTSDTQPGRCRWRLLRPPACRPGGL